MNDGRWKNLGLVCLSVLALAGCATLESPQTGETVAADGRMPVPAAAAERVYLGLNPEATHFTLCDVQAELIFVDFFDMYCHVCQTSAKHVNELYRLVEGRGLDDRVKFFGIAVGNTPLEAETFRKKFELPFPIFPDRKGTVTRSLGDLRVPGLLVLRKQADGLQVIHRSKGVTGKTEDLLEHVLADAAQQSPADGADDLHAGQPICDENKIDCRVIGDKSTSSE